MLITNIKKDIKKEKIRKEEHSFKLLEIEYNLDTSHLEYWIFESFSIDNLK